MNLKAKNLPILKKKKNDSSGQKNKLGLNLRTKKGQFTNVIGERGGSSETRADSTDSGLSSSHDKDSLVDFSQSLENLLVGLSTEGITKATAMSASDKVINTIMIRPLILDKEL